MLTQQKQRRFKELNWHKALSEGESELRGRWNRLRMPIMSNDVLSLCHAFFCLLSDYDKIPE